MATIDQLSNENAALQEQTRDLSARLEASQKELIALRENEERFRSLVDDIQVAVGIQGAEGEMVYANPKTLDLLGVSNDQAMDRKQTRTPWQAFHEDGSPLLPNDRPVMQVIHKRGSVRDFIARVRRPKQGDDIWLLINATPRFAADGSVKEVVTVSADITALKQAEELIRRQAEMLEQLSTPLIPISDEVVVMPLIGMVDSHRIQQVMTTLLEGISARRAKVGILDVTGVAIVDTMVADGLIRIAQAVRLLGAEVLITGIRPELAQSLVALGINMQGVITSATLQSGIAFAMGRR
jgi:rsbT co-antagonist protein RsbR